MGQVAYLDDAKGRNVYTFVVTKLAVSKSCTSPSGALTTDAKGSFLTVDVEVDTTPTFDPSVNSTSIWNPFELGVVGPVGVTHMNVATSSPCAVTDSHPNNAVPASKYVFQVVVDSPSPTGTLIYRPSSVPAGWEYAFPS